MNREGDSEATTDTGKYWPGPAQNDMSDAEVRRLFLNATDRPGDATAWRMLGRALLKSDNVGAAVAYARSITAALADETLAAIDELLRKNALSDAARLLKARLARDGDDIVALKLAADLAARMQRPTEAERHYRRCIRLCPSYVAARHGLSRLLLRQARLGEASEETERMLAVAPTDPAVRTLKAAVAAAVGDHADAAALYAGLVRALPRQPGLWLGLGHSERTIGRVDAAISAYGKALEIPAGAAEAYWSLSNLKTYAFGDRHVEQMEELVRTADGRSAVFLHFALGQAFHGRGDEERAFAHFAKGNAAKRATISYDAARQEAQLERWTSSLTASDLSVPSTGDSSTGPIFVVGLPRSGSTLVEQILGSHSMIESTSELPYLDRIAMRLRRRGMAPMQERSRLDLEGVDVALLGREYLRAAQVHRRSTRPFFVDKFPGNFAHAALIRRILPGAKIIDVRRDPLATTWSIFKQLFAHGQPFAYDLLEIARWYRGYVAAMERFDALMPGAVFSIRYEDLVEEPDSEIRRLLAHIGVPFEDRCLVFHENGNAVRTPSSEQVRRPIFRDGLDEWKRYETYLRPAAEILAVQTEHHAH